MFNRFVPLLQREWMQHQRGWIVLMGAPVVLVLLASLFAPIGVHVQIDGDTVVQQMPMAVVQAFGSVAGIAALTLGLVCVSSLFQAPGLARRDQQDRSIEFWMSLPIGHVQSLSATLLTHLLFVPWLALVVGAVSGLLVSVVVVSQSWGVGAWFSLPWGALLAGLFALLLRLALGLLLALLWLSPLILMLMAASAWLKRWGVPIVVGTVGGLGVLMSQLYHNHVIGDTLASLLDNASRALIVAERTGAPRKLVFQPDSDLGAFLQGLPSWALHDAGDALHALASLQFVAAVGVAAACFALLVLRRQRGR